MFLTTTWYRGDLEMLKWLYKKHIDGYERGVLENAIDGGKHEIVKWLLVNVDG